MKKFVILASLFILAGTSCQTLQQNLEARRNLAKCKYEFQSVVVRGIELDGIKLRAINLDIILKVTNTTRSDVALDRVEGDIFLDQHKTANLAHKQFTRIRPSESKRIAMSSQVPFSDALRVLGRKPKNITLVSKVYMSMLIGSYSLQTPISFEVRKTVPIPYSAIGRMIQRKGSSLIRSLF